MRVTGDGHLQVLVPGEKQQKQRERVRAPPTDSHTPLQFQASPPFPSQARASVAAAMGAGGSRARQNAMRSGVVVLGAVAFGYLSFRVGFKPYLDQAQEAMDSSQDPAAAAVARDASDDSGAGRPAEGVADLAPSKDPAVVLRD